jgi:hypothetical protein
MIRTALTLSVLAFVVSPVACKKKGDDTGKSKSEASDDDGKKKTKKDDNAGEEESDKPTKAGSKGCKPPKENELEADWTIPGNCKVAFTEDLTVSKGATITVEPGAKLTFSANKHLWISNGKLVAKGTDEKPITFTSANSSPSAGDWDGLIYDAEASGGNVLDHVIIEYAGHEGGYAHGAITVHGTMSGGRLSITNSSFAHNAQSAIFNDKDKAKFGKLESNTFTESGGASMILHPEVVGSVGSNKLDLPIKVKHGDITASAKWPKATFLIEDDIALNGKGSAAILTLADKSTLKFAPQKHLWIGGGDGGGIVGKGVTFTSANATGAEGDWAGLIVDSKASGSMLEDCIIEYAGHEGGYAHASVTYHDSSAAKLKGFKMKNCTFRHNHGGGIAPNDEKGCGELATDNKSEGQPICVTKH